MGLSSSLARARSKHQKTRQYPQSQDQETEQYLQSIFSKECQYSGKEDIETGIESLVNQILSDYFNEYRISSTINSINILNDYELLKVGSYYEETKNHFPDEFDYMVVFGETSTRPTAQVFPKLEPLIRIVNEKKETYKYVAFRSKRASSVTVGRSTVRLRKSTLKKNVCESAMLEVFDVIHNGPAQTMHFRYINGSNESRLISVDLVFALRSNNVENHLGVSQVSPQNFYREVEKTGRVYYIAKPIESPVKIVLTLTETEVHFMKYELSTKHVQVYRLLKYLINGHEYNADQHGLARHSVGFNITSYEIKCLIIHHHYSCRNLSENLTECVLTILHEFNHMLDPNQRPDFQTKFDKFLLQNEDTYGSLFSKTVLYGSFEQRKEIWQASSVFIRRLKNVDNAAAKFQHLKPFRVMLNLQKRDDANDKRLGMDVNKALYLGNSENI